MRPALRTVLLGARLNPASLLGPTNGFFFDFRTGATGTGIASVTSQPPSTLTAVQALAPSQPVWTAGPPDSAVFDGIDDNLLSNLTPSATAMTIAACYRGAGGAAEVATGTAAASNGRAFIGNVSGVAAAGWGANSSATITTGVTVTNQDVMLLFRTDSVTDELWLAMNGLAPRRFYSGASSGAPAATVMAVGARNVAGVINFTLNGKLYTAFSIQSFLGSTSMPQLMRSLSAGVLSF